MLSSSRVKIPFLFLFILSLSQATWSISPSCASRLKKSAPLKTEIIVDGKASSRDRKLLKDQARALLTAVAKSLTIPEKVMFILSEQSPMYDMGMIQARYPFFVDFGGEKRVFKSAQESLAINLHELTHQIFESHLMGRFKLTDPEVLWAFYTRMDMRGEGLSRMLIEETRANSKFKDKTTDEIVNHFFEFVVLGEYYNELLADTLPVLFMHDPDAIYNSIYFGKVEKEGDEFDAGFQKTHEFRRFASPHTVASIKVHDYPDSYMMLSPTKNFIWEKIFPLIKDLPKGDEQLGVVADRIIQAIVASFKDLTTNFTKPRKISIEELNSNLQKHLTEKFK